MAPTRRLLLKAAGAAAAAIGVNVAFARFAVAAPLEDTAPLASPDPSPQPVGPALSVISGERSPNGWLINTATNAGGGVWTRPVPGSGVDVDIALGDAEVILLHVIRRFHYEVDTLERGDVVGFIDPSRLGGYELNHASGTAVDILPGRYPAGALDGFYSYQVAVIRDILAECQGVVRWGRDLPQVCEAHFQIDVPPTDPRVVALARTLRGWDDTAGLGAGAVPDVWNPDRRSAALGLEGRQRVATRSR